MEEWLFWVVWINSVSLLLIAAITIGRSAVDHERAYVREHLKKAK